MDLISIKILSFFSILAIAIIGGSIPLWWAKWTESERFFSLGNAFAGGLFLGVGFMHLLPEGIEQLAHFSGFPLGTAVATAGFALLLLIDRVLFPENDLGEAIKEAGTRTFYPYVLLGMLSIHSIVAGVALGLEQHLAGAITLLVGILFHKGPAAFALILSARSGNVNPSRQRVFLGLFCLMTPLGILLGISGGSLFISEDRLYLLLQGIFNAFAAGTFIYIAVIDIIDKELTLHQLQIARYSVSAAVGNDDVAMPVPKRDRFLKFGLIVLGIVLVALISEWLHSAHGHSQGHAHTSQLIYDEKTLEKSGDVANVATYGAQFGLRFTQDSAALPTFAS